MKWILLSPETKRPTWIESYSEEMVRKISFFKPFEILSIKSPTLSRKESGKKRELECEGLLKKIEPKDFVILFDEKGKNVDSNGFLKEIQKIPVGGMARAIFVIGGAFGVDPSLKNRANLCLCLSQLTLNHLVAQTVVLEQIYRSQTIEKGIPYHNS